MTFVVLSGIVFFELLTKLFGTLFYKYRRLLICGRQIDPIYKIIGSPQAPLHE